MNRDSLQKLVSVLPKDASLADIAAALSRYGSVYALTDSERGDVGLNGGAGGGLRADAWGKGARKSDARGARALFDNVPDDTNIGIRIDGTEHVFDARRRKVRGPRFAMSGSLRSPTHSRPRQPERKRESQMPPAPPSRTKAHATLLKARARGAELESKLREEEKGLSDLLAGAERATARAARRKKSIGRSFVDALREGRDPPDFSDDRDKILRDETEASARQALIPETEERVRQARLALEAHKGTLDEASLDLDAALTAEALRDAERGLKQLFEPLAALEAVAVVRARLLGHSFAFDPRQRRAPLGTAEIVSAIVGGIPPSLAASLSRDAINARAHKIAAELLADFQPRTNGE